MPGIPSSLARVAMTIIDSTMIAPTDRSMPAVRMTSVWPTARAATTAVCCSRMPIELAVKNVGVAMKNATNVIEQQEQRAQPGPAVQLVLDSLQRGVLPPSELGGSRVNGRHGQLPQQIFAPWSEVMLWTPRPACPSPVRLRC